MIDRVQANGIDIAYETFGRRNDPPLVLVMGLGAQMISWHDDFCHMLADRRFHVVRFDNRDAGMSTHLHDAPVPDVAAALAGDASSAAYRMEDMADDTLGLAEALDLGRAHLVGVSMGGAIAQTATARHPDRVRSLTSIMSSPAPHIGAPGPEALESLLLPPARSRDEVVERALRSAALTGSPGYPLDEQWIIERARRSYERGYDPLGVSRQLVALCASGDRTAMLGGIRLPTLVVHGEQDVLVQPEGGYATARAIPGARLLTFPGMGHDLPRALWPAVVEAIAQVAQQAGP